MGGRKRLVLYSDQRPGGTGDLDQCLLDFLRGSEHRVAFIPSTTDRHRRYFSDATAHYRTLGVSAPTLCDVGDEWDASAFTLALRADAIHLGSGDPRTLLANIRRRSLGAPLAAFVARGGVLVGVSAGAMVMSASIALSELSSGNVPRGEGRSRGRRSAHDSRALGLVNIDFYPHFDDTAAERERLARFTRSTDRVLVACSDDQGVVVLDDDILLKGAPARFAGGTSTS